MKVFTVIQGIRIRRLLLLLFRHGITPLPIYLLRFLVLLWGAIPSSILSRVEYLKYGRRIRESDPVRDPIFIVGHWRTGSTYLHQLLNLHPDFTAPTMVQTSIPDHFLFSTPYYVPILKKALPPTRPMDNVQLDPFEPQEEEFALLRLGAESPFTRLLFPCGPGYFLSDARHVPEGKALVHWKRKLDLFYRKIQLESGKKIISKNPWHSLRMEVLAEMYPGARFIHITREPETVVLSTIRMWDIVARDNALKNGWSSPPLKEVCQVLKQFLEGIRKSAKTLPPGRHMEISFEELEKDPPGEIRRLFRDMDLEFSPEFERALEGYLEGKNAYRKNNYTPRQEDLDFIRSYFS